MLGLKKVFCMLGSLVMVLLSVLVFCLFRCLSVRILIGWVRDLVLFCSGEVVILILDSLVRWL